MSAGNNKAHGILPCALLLEWLLRAECFGQAFVPSFEAPGMCGFSATYNPADNHQNNKYPVYTYFEKFK